MSQQSIKNLRVYTLAHGFEDAIASVVASLPEAEQYGLATSLRRTSAAIAHYIYEAHRRYSYTLKLDSLYSAIAEAESAKKLLLQYKDGGFGDSTQLQEDCVSIIKQCWGLIKYFQGQRSQKQSEASIKAVDELVASRR